MSTNTPHQAAPVAYSSLLKQRCPEHNTEATRAVTSYDLERQQRTFRITCECGCVLAGDVKEPRR